MSEMNQIDALYPIQYTVTRNEVPIYDKNLSQIGNATIGTKLISIGHQTTPNGENVQVLLGSADDHIFMFKDDDFLNGEDPEIAANDLETHADPNMVYTELTIDARVKDICTTYYGPGEEYFQFNRLQKGQKVVVKGTTTYKRALEGEALPNYAAVYQKSKKSDELRYLGFVPSGMLDFLVAAPVEEAAPEPTVEEKVDEVVQMEEGPKKEAAKEEIRNDLLSQPITVMGFKVDTDVKRNNVYNKLGQVLEDGCAMVELGDGKTYASLISAGFKTMPKDYKTTLYVIVPNDLAINLKKKMVGRGLKPIIITRG